MLNEICKEELRRLSLRERGVVLDGLDAKLSAARETGKVSYRYDLCPVCADVGSTEERDNCDSCYIKVCCKKPFVDGFKEDNEKSYQYFHDMWTFLMRDGRVLVVGGEFSNEYPRSSKIVQKLAECLCADCINGGSIYYLDKLAGDLATTTKYELVVWMPNVSNKEEKSYPTKSRGSVLICSKVMRDGYTRVDSAKRIFAMRANAVIELHKNRPKGIWEFSLVDALSNEWRSSSDIADIAEAILELAMWTKESERVPSVQSSVVDVLGLRNRAEKFIKVVSSIADKVESGTPTRYFGNYSTRCQSLFPSMRNLFSSVLVSPRNLDKRRADADDFILVSRGENGEVQYFGERKPSVDTAIQLKIYEEFLGINYLIHGHAYVRNYIETEDFFPCGDLREFSEISKVLYEMDCTHGVINLKNHGFLIFSDTINHLYNLADSLVFEDRLVMEE